MQTENGTGGNAAGNFNWSEAWTSVQEYLRRELGDPVFEAWIQPLTFVSAEKGRVTVSAAKPFVRNWVANHYSPRLIRAFRAIGAPVEFVDVRLPTTLPAEILYSVLAPSNAAPNASPRPQESKYNPAQTFDAFIPSSANEFCYKAALAFATGEPTIESNVLVIEADPGFGKSHLLNAIASTLDSRGEPVLFLRGAEFMRSFLNSLHRKEAEAFRTRVRVATVLVLDDLQSICRSLVAAAELLATLQSFEGLGHKVVLATNRPIAAFEGLGTELTSRLSGGLTVQLYNPDQATQRLILDYRTHAFCKSHPWVHIPENVLDALAEHKYESPRQLVAAFTHVASNADITRKSATPEMVANAFNRPLSSVTKISIDDIQRKVADFYKLEARDFASPTRARRVARPRQVAMYLSRQLTARSLPEIGRHFGGRDHTTVLHACRRIEALCIEDSLYQQEVDFLKVALTAH